MHFGRIRQNFKRFGALCACILAIFALGCRSKPEGSAGAAPSTASSAPFMSAAAAIPPQTPDDAPLPASTGGFDGKRAFAHVAKQVSFGPHPSGSQAIIRVQDYIQSELKNYGCKAETDSFTSDTPAGRLPMKNILVKILGEKPGIILFGTHYDTKRLDNFVGADDGGSSTGVMLELARWLCSQHGRYNVWIAFFDGEEAVNFEWKDPDNRYGSRQMAARLSMSGDLPKIKAFLLADLVGGRTPHFKRDDTSTEWLNTFVWGVAAKLGYASIFIEQRGNIGGDDHFSFTQRKVPAVDVIDLDTVNDVPYWHTPQDTLDKISAKTLAIVGHVFLECVKQLQAR
jgi:glutaminyl-peptide cyclotransferase